MNRFKFKESDVQKVIKHLQSGPPLSVREEEKQAVVPGQDHGERHWSPQVGP